MPEAKGKAQADYELLQSIAPRLFRDDPEKAEAFVNKAMGQLGHRPITNWEDAEEEENEEEEEEEEEGLLGGTPPPAKRAPKKAAAPPTPPAPPSGKSYWRK